MGHSGDDAVHKTHHEMKKHQQNQLKILVLVYFDVLHRIRYEKRGAILVQCAFNPHILHNFLSELTPFLLRYQLT